jgi:DNA-binding response OmpR family regulator
MSHRILIVDDEISICKMLVIGLKAQGFEAEYALSGAQALAIIYTHPPDAIILDLMMPDTDGFEVTRYLRGQSATEKLPIVILSATARQDAEEEALRLGANIFVRKPVTPRDLAATVRKVIESVRS